MLADDDENGARACGRRDRNTDANEQAVVKIPAFGKPVQTALHPADEPIDVITAAVRRDEQ